MTRSEWWSTSSRSGLDERGFDAERRALWGWSMGGYGAIQLTESYPDFARAVAAFSPAIGSDDAVLDDLSAFREVPLGLWCGKQDPFYDTTRLLAAGARPPPEVEGYGEGGHTRVFWNEQTLDAFAFLAGHLA
jgi:S-formylglutathione hydrolase FrmB